MKATSFFVLLSLTLLFTVATACDDDNNGEQNNSVNTTNNTNTTNATNTTNNTNNTNNTNTTSQGCTAPPRAFWNYDLSVMPPGNVQIPSSCRGMGETLYVYVADSAWEEGQVTQEMVDDVVLAWEEGTTPQGVGIYGGVTTVFGEPPDVDDDPHIVVFITPLGAYQGTAFDGYFRPENQTAGTGSNLTEMVYIDCEHHAPNSDYLLGVLAHEFQHLIQYGLDRNEEGWLNETFSQAAMVVTGYWSDLAAANAYLGSHTDDTPLVVQDSRYYSYGAGFLFASYLLDRYGETFFTELSGDPAHGEASINNALVNHEGAGFDLHDLLLDWGTASLVRDCALGLGQYCYLTLGESQLTATPQVHPATTGDTTLTLPYSAYTYLSYRVVAGQALTLSGDGTSIKVKAILQTDSGDQVHDLDLSPNGSVALPVPSGEAVLILVVLNVGSQESVTVSVHE